MELTRPQLMALEHVTNYARTFKNETEANINHILKMSIIKHALFEMAVSNLKAQAKIGLHFHPDRQNSSTKLIAESLFEQGIYKSQFETLLSNGIVSAYPGDNAIYGNKDSLVARIN